MTPFAIYFPQFYAIPTNDRAWGRGFTDWTLVAHANLRDAWPRRAPARGYYDGASERVHGAQIEEAVAAGLGGFAVYHYWFFSHQELGAFESTLLGGRAPAFPWYLVWANEGWSRRWIGDPSSILPLDRAPAPAAIERHCEYLARCFDHEDYFRVGGRPVFAWYNLAHFTQPERVVEAYRREWRRCGFDPLVAHFVKNWNDAALSPLAEANYLFEPRLFFALRRKVHGVGHHTLLRLVTRALGERAGATLLAAYDRLAQRGRTYSAKEFLDYVASPIRSSFVSALRGPVQEVVSPGWNNCPRYGARFTALEPLDPEPFAALVRDSGEAPVPPLINAWNEWSEGAAIEPCAYLGRRYLDALGDAGASEGASAAQLAPAALTGSTRP